MHKIDINLRVSLQFNLLIAMVTLASIAIILTLTIPVTIKAFLLLFVAVYSILIYREQGVQMGRGLKLTSEGWFLRDNSGFIAVDLLGESTITAFVCVLRFKPPGSTKKRTCVVFNDALSHDDYRRLTVQLRTSAAYQAERVRRGSYMITTKTQSA
jgi:hypothetical protein